MTQSTRGGANSARWQLWLLTAASLAAFILVVANMFLYWGNYELRQELAKRQQYINESLRVGQVNNALIQNLVAAAARTNDEDIRAMLEANGVTYRLSPEQQGQAQPQQAASPPVSISQGEEGANE